MYLYLIIYNEYSHVVEYSPNMYFLMSGEGGDSSKPARAECTVIFARLNGTDDRDMSVIVSHVRQCTDIVLGEMFPNCRGLFHFAVGNIFLLCCATSQTAAYFKLKELLLGFDTRRIMVRKLPRRTDSSTMLIPIFNRNRLDRQKFGSFHNNCAVNLQL